ncbi:MAG TPA: serine hydrolase [Gemmatimonadaceae bacterium]|nr:serine hydrolase [Gemmatimonadaceae bacterium]
MLKRTISTSLLAALLIPCVTANAQSNARFDSLIDAHYKPDEPGGVALIARGGRVVYERAFGMANLELAVPMKTSAVFSIASMTKQFTAVAVLQQVEKGTISLRDSVGKFLPTFPDAYKGITIEQLLTHTAGVPNAKSVATLLAMGRGWLSADQVIATFKDQPLDFKPGSNSNYSNSGYQLLGYIMEKVTGEPFPEFVETTLLKPAGMDHSLWGNDMRVVPNRAYPYLFTRNGIENAVNGNVQIAWAAGAIQSTAEDFFKWHQALVAGKFISRAMLQKAWTAARLPDNSATDYGYGWFIGELQGSPLVEHGGNMGGFMSHAMYLPREDLLVAVFLNSRGKRLPELIATDLAATAIGRPLDITLIVLSNDVLQSYAGTYKDRNNVDVVISLDNGKLVYQKTGGPKWMLTPYAKDKFFFDNTSTVGEMQRDSQGRIVRFAMQTIRGQSKNVIMRVRPSPAR